MKITEVSMNRFKVDNATNSCLAKPLGELSISFSDDFDLEEHIQEVVLGERRMETRRFAAGVTQNAFDPTYADRYSAMSEEDVSAMVEGQKRGDLLDKEAWARVKRSCENDEKMARNHYSVKDPVQRLLDLLVWYLKSDAEDHKGQWLGPLRADLTEVLHSLRRVREECIERHIRGKDHPLSPQIFFEMWKIAAADGKYNRTLVPGDEDYEYYAAQEEESWSEEEPGPVYLMYSCPSELDIRMDGWADVNFIASPPPTEK